MKVETMSEKSLQELWDELVPVRILLTVRGFEQREREFVRAMAEIGLGNFEVQRAEKAKDKKHIDREIFYSHWLATERALAQHPGKNFAIFEDDCRPIDDLNAARELAREALETIARPDTRNKWSIFNLGFFNLGLFHRQAYGKHIYACTMPFAAHSYIMNGSGNRDLISAAMVRKPKFKWRRPFAVEGWMLFPTSQKWVLNPGMTHQNVLPRGQSSFPIVRNLTYQQLAPAWNSGFSAALMVIIVTLCLAALFPAGVIVATRLKRH
jgi:hypothetical protein